ncbi:hypothetical protein [Natrinema versiforme]|uniref:Uncharacterized protein n=1 Tax=Natrinema versiforme TaxID=88724 RepID=A0A4P8WMA2_9EURY|nr:hypothetical protein [Natrinema versiforme]QCS44534.1 hypothetical protein FEJ81_19635 [Natrinema versiforme]
MNRRQILGSTGVGLLPFFAGCLTANDETETPTREENNNSTETNGTEETPQLSCSLHIEILEEPPEDAQIVSAEEEHLLAIGSIKRIFEKATTSNK